MKRMCLVILLSALYLIFSALPAMAQKITGPLVIVKEGSFDFKEVKEGAVLEHVFKILNKGDQTLKIEKVKPG